MAEITLRLAEEKDAKAVLEIYAEYINDKTAGLEMTPPTCEEVGTRICLCQGMYPFLVAELSGEIVGYAYAIKHMEEAAFGYNAKVSMYAAKQHAGKGIGRALYEALEGILKAMGVINLYSLTTFHPKGEYFHQGRGFMEAGRLRKAAFVHGKWRDLIYYEKSLALHEQSPQAVKQVSKLTQEELQGIYTKAKKLMR